jgi:hypothetical protein
MTLHLSTTGWIVIVFLLFVIVSINVSLIYAVKNHSLSKSIDIIRKTGQVSRQPWKKEDQMLSDLSKKVADLKKEDRELPRQ